MSRRNSTEIVHEGWLTKSPPIKRIWRARWRRRWFVLRQTGELPGQYFLEYYTDRHCLKLKGRVDLDQCEQVDAGLQFENRKLKYLKYLFDLKTPKRTYYLCADNEADMNKWVDCVCQVCGLKADNHEDDYYDFGPPIEEESTVIVNSSTLNSSVEQSSPGTGDDSAPVTPSSSTTSTSTPYIFISECYSGKPPPGVLSRAAEQELLRLSQQPWRAEKPVKLTREDLSHDEFYDMPRKLHPPELELGQQRSATPPLQSPGGDSVFSEEEWQHVPSVNWNTFPRDSTTSEVEIRNPRPSDSSDGPPATDLGPWSVARRFSKVCIDNKNTDKKSRKQSVEEDKVNPPPRPPKPSHFADAPSHNYLNIASVLSQSSNIYDNQKTISPSPSKLEHRDSGVATMSDRCHSPGSIAPTADDMYDFPRSHQQMGEESKGPRHCYSNAAPGQANGTVFRYDFAVENPGQIEADPSLEPSTPKSETGSHSSAVYSNLPSPLRLPGTPVVAPPCVNRELKPGRKLSDSTSNEPSPNPSHSSQQLGPLAPSVDRGLKPFPFRKVPDSPKPEFGGLTLAAPPGFRSGSESRVRRKTRAAPSPTPPGTTPVQGGGGVFGGGYSSSEDEHRFRDSADEEQNFYYLEDDRFVPASKKRFDKVKYLDLDHEMGVPSPKSKPVPTPEKSTIYNTVDFVKTKAFNRTRQEVELERQHPSSTHKAQSASPVPS